MKIHELRRDQLILKYIQWLKSLFNCIRSQNDRFFFTNETMKYHFSFCVNLYL